MSLASPKQWVEPALRQAWADFLVAEHLARTEVKGVIYEGSSASDAALDKLQQGLEKLLKALILIYSPEQSGLFFDHRLLTNPASDPAFRKISKAMGLDRKELLGNEVFVMIETLAPVGKQGAKHQRDGKIVGLRENTQYPYTKTGKNKRQVVIAPCDGIRIQHEETLRRGLKEVHALFKRVQKNAELFLPTEIESLLREIGDFRF